jgi:hypothetical protein
MSEADWVCILFKGVSKSVPPDFLCPIHHVIVKNNQTHFAFSLPEVAAIARKSSRTIRRWCQLGFVKGAQCSKGGHWKVRVFITATDKWLAEKRSRATGAGYDVELQDRAREKVWDAVKPPAGFERGKGVAPAREWSVSYKVRKSGPIESVDVFTGEPIVMVPLKQAWEIAAAFEWAESVGAGRSLAPVLDRIKRLGYMPIPKECLSYKLQAEIQTALENAGHKTLFMGFYGAARNTLQATGKCSVAAVCRKLGVSRSTAYRHDAAGAVALAKKELVNSLHVATSNAPRRTRHIDPTAPLKRQR